MERIDYTLVAIAPKSCNQCSNLLDDAVVIRSHIICKVCSTKSEYTMRLAEIPEIPEKLQAIITAGGDEL